MHNTILHLLVADGCFILFQMRVSKNVLCFLLYFYAAKSLQSCPADNQQKWPGYGVYGLFTIYKHSSLQQNVIVCLFSLILRKELKRLILALVLISSGTTLLLVMYVE